MFKWMTLPYIYPTVKKLNQIYKRFPPFPNMVANFNSFLCKFLYITVFLFKIKFEEMFTF